MKNQFIKKLFVIQLIHKYKHRQELKILKPEQNLRKYLKPLLVKVQKEVQANIKLIQRSHLLKCYQINGNLKREVLKSLLKSLNLG